MRTEPLLSERTAKKFSQTAILNDDDLKAAVSNRSYETIIEPWLMAESLIAKEFKKEKRGKKHRT